MKRAISLVAVIILTISLCGCEKLVGGNFLEMCGIKFDSQIEMIEDCLSINLDDLTDDSIKTIYSDTDPNGNSVSIQYISLEGAGNVIEPIIQNSNRWSALPLSDIVDKILSANKVYDEFDFSKINGYFTISGVLPNEDGFNFNKNNINVWEVYEIGIWDSNDETLYYVSITKQ